MTLQDLVRAWQRRSEEIRSGRFSWTVQSWVRQDLADYAPERRNIPKEGHSFTQTCSLVFDGALVRFENRMPSWHPHLRGYHEQRGVFAWNGHVGKDFADRQNYSSADLWGVNYYAVHKELRAFQAAFRMDFPGWHEFNPKDFIIADRSARLEGSRCLVIEHSPAYLRAKVAAGRNPIKSSYWVSPQRGFAVVRYTESVHGKLAREFELSYHRDAEHGWIPAKWTETYVDSAGNPTQSYRGLVSDYELDIPVDGQTFELEFPEGTLVTDFRSGAPYDEYLVRDGKMHLITPGGRRRAGSPRL